MYKRWFDRPAIFCIWDISSRDHLVKTFIQPISVFSLILVLNCELNRQIFIRTYKQIYRSINYVYESAPRRECSDKRKVLRERKVPLLSLSLLAKSLEHFNFYSTSRKRSILTSRDT